MPKEHPELRQAYIDMLQAKHDELVRLDAHAHALELEFMLDSITSHSIEDITAAWEKANKASLRIKATGKVQRFG
jgi:hypothetical protein